MEGSRATHPYYKSNPPSSTGAITQDWESKPKAQAQAQAQDLRNPKAVKKLEAGPYLICHRASKQRMYSNGRQDRLVAQQEMSGLEVEIGGCR
ncbi:hypothetical protein VNO78_32343 [Psophocarpus tetragonolobus]|uniref:Uncharacterized protein n=1 Tax=Psophocarpus tetragonolobus TaxID=3891 RepID=A0AAN9RQ37_PSOTE